MGEKWRRAGVGAMKKKKMNLVDTQWEALMPSRHYSGQLHPRTYLHFYRRCLCVMDPFYAIFTADSAWRDISVTSFCWFCAERVLIRQFTRAWRPRRRHICPALVACCSAMDPVCCFLYFLPSSFLIDVFKC